MLTLQSWLKAFLPPTAVNSLKKISGHHTHQTLTLLIIISELAKLEHYKTFHPQAKEHRRAEVCLARFMHVRLIRAAGCWFPL